MDYIFTDVDSKLDAHYVEFCSTNDFNSSITETITKSKKKNIKIKNRHACTLMDKPYFL